MPEAHLRALGLLPGSSSRDLVDAFRARVLEACSARPEGATQAASAKPSLSHLAAAFEGALLASQVPSAATRPSTTEVVEASITPSLVPKRRCDKHPSPSGKVQSGDRTLEGLLAKLHQLLRELPADARRTVIGTQLAESQRLALERWMLRSKQGPVPRATRPGAAASNKKRRRQGSREVELVPAAHIWRCNAGRGRYFASVHLGEGLHVQCSGCPDLARAVDALALLLSLRARRRSIEASAANCLQEDRLFEGTVKAAFHEVCGSDESHQLRTAGAEGLRLFLRVRQTFGRGIRLSTPLQSKLKDALYDWRLMGSRLEGSAAAFQGAPRATVAQRWASSSKAWASLWAQRGKPQSQLTKQLAELEVQIGPRLAAAERRRRVAYNATCRKLARLLAHKAWKKCGHEPSGSAIELRPTLKRPRLTGPGGS